MKKNHYISEKKQITSLQKTLKRKERDPLDNLSDDDIGEEDEEFETGYIEGYDKSGSIPEECFLSEGTEKELNDQMEAQNIRVLKIKKILRYLGKDPELAKFYAPRILWVFDDMVGNDMFHHRRTNTYKRLAVRHRHYCSSTITVTQAYKEIPKTPRTNTSGLVLFNIPNDSELKMIYQENPCGLKIREFKEIYDYATLELYHFLFINYQKPLKDRLYKDFDSIPLNSENIKGMINNSTAENLSKQNSNSSSETETETENE